ncbi:hypothetical protein [Thiomicrorhabdus chilensis]|uniref:hypothetical protein n=1 Tax=Thiomicrorhabdus chilensis TaxID=63656 RepID=UPI0003FC36C6|nr:hypothetical protein [Thiomicrorhabdus chilensis]
MQTLFRSLLCFVLIGCFSNVTAEIEISQSLDGLTPQEKAWLLDDSNLDAMTVASEQLVWSDKANKQSYWLKNELKINTDSLKTGWVQFSQCHFQLDPVPKIEVAYHPENTRNLKVVAYQGIERAHATHHRVVLTNVTRGAQVCIQGESRTLTLLESGFYIQRGPYMRKFLDGYYPMIVEEIIELNKIRAVLVKHTPINPKAKESASSGGSYRFAYSFEGQLRPYYEFNTAQD